MSESNDADVTLEKVLRPGWRFEADYASISGDVPILFTWPSAKEIPLPGRPDLSVLDQEARVANPPPGISPALAKFAPACIGSTLLMLIPIVPALLPGSKFAYVWRVLFRQRSAGDYTRNPGRNVRFSVPRTSYGSNDSRNITLPDRPALVFAGPRYVMPASAEGSMFAKTTQTQHPGDNQNIALSSIASPAFADLLPEVTSLPVSAGMTTLTAIYPGASSGGNVSAFLDYQQGVIDPALFPFHPNVSLPSYVANSATFLPKWVKCLGNEIAVECFKYVYEVDAGRMVFTKPGVWDFTPNTGEDFYFSVMFGIGATGLTPPQTPPVDTGVRFIQGTMPQ